MRASDDDHSRLVNAKRSSEILEHASRLELSPTVIAFIFATSFSAMECCKLELKWFVRYVLVSAYI